MATLGTTGCGPSEDAGDDLVAGDPQPAAGLSNNGLSANGLSANGLSANGLSANGLSANGLSATSFKGWFNGNIPLGDEVMRYVVKCALEAGTTLRFTDKNGVNHSWAGGLGLAPAWATGSPNTVEQEVISACLMAHVNNSGLMGVGISVRGDVPLRSGVTTIPLLAWEKYSYANQVKEVYFGNLFLSSPVKHSLARNPPTDAWPALARTWGRECAIGFASTGDCGGMVNLSEATCTFNSADVATACSQNGRTWSYPITVALPWDQPDTSLACYSGGCPKRVYTGADPWLGRGLRCDGTVDTFSGFDIAVNGVNGNEYSCGLDSSSKGLSTNWYYPAFADYGMEIRYANGTSGNAMMRFRCAGKAWTTVYFKPTGAWYKWSRMFLRYRVPAVPGKVTCDLIGPSAGTAPYIDHVARTVMPAGSVQPGYEQTIP